MSESYAAIKALHSTLPAFRPPVPTALLPYIALVALALFFALTFTFTALRRTSNPLPEFGITLTASTLAGAGVVALFCTVGVYI